MKKRKGNYDEVYATRSLLTKKGVSVDGVNKIVAIGSAAEFGIRIKGKLDYLVNHCGYVVVRSNAGSNRPKITTNAINSVNENRLAKADKKLGKLKTKH